jgi:hypothetical protein
MHASTIQLGPLIILVLGEEATKQTNYLTCKNRALPADDAPHRAGLQDDACAGGSCARRGCHGVRSSLELIRFN